MFFLWLGQHFDNTFGYLRPPRYVNTMPRIAKIRALPQAMQINIWINQNNLFEYDGGVCSVADITDDAGIAHGVKVIKCAVGL